MPFTCLFRPPSRDNGNVAIVVIVVDLVIGVDLLEPFEAIRAGRGAEAPAAEAAAASTELRDPADLGLAELAALEVLRVELDVEGPEELAEPAHEARVEARRDNDDVALLFLLRLGQQAVQRLLRLGLQRLEVLFEHLPQRTVRLEVAPRHVHHLEDRVKRLHYGLLVIKVKCVLKRKNAN